MLLYITIALIVIFIALVVRLEIKINNLLGGSNAKNIQEGMQILRSEIKDMQAFSENASGYLKDIDSRVKGSVSHVKTVRYNPFAGTGVGGNQSFSTALLNEHGDGVVFSALHSRERISVFAKPIVAYKSEHELSAEEKEVIAVK
jgi:hypothetical protein